nr:uncharacterized protein LOC110073245 isoform X1 [Pogona vitticeps]XP_020637873.1 uncharacterized protein LOC110073245 isoform X1 [Pogona vitticeps]
MAFLVHPQLIIFLLALLASWPKGAAAAEAAALPVPEGLMWKHSKHDPMPVYSKVNPTVFSEGYTQALTDTRKREKVFAFLSGLVDWASRMNQAPLLRQEKVAPMPREERAASLQPSVREKAPSFPPINSRQHVEFASLPVLAATL